MGSITPLFPALFVFFFQKILDRLLTWYKISAVPAASVKPCQFKRVEDPAHQVTGVASSLDNPEGDFTASSSTGPARLAGSAALFYPP